MPKWVGMTIHYLTFKKVLTSRNGWVFTWGGPRKVDKVFVLSPPPSKCCSCKTSEKLEARRIRKDTVARARERENIRKAAGEVAVVDNHIQVYVPAEELESEVKVGVVGGQDSVRNW